MNNPSALSVEEVEAHLPHWEKWLYLTLGATIIMLIQGFITHYENTLLTDLMFVLENQGIDIREFAPRYLFQGSYVQLSFWRLLLWSVVELAALFPAAILGLHSRWRKIALSKRLDLIGGFLLAGWINLLALGVTDPFNMSDGYSIFLILYLLLLGGGYWSLRRKHDQAEEIFP